MLGAIRLQATEEADRSSDIYLILFFFDSFKRVIPINDPITDIARTNSAAAMAIAYILGGNRFNTAGSSMNGCNPS